MFNEKELAIKIYPWRGAASYPKRIIPELIKIAVERANEVLEIVDWVPVPEYDLFYGEFRAAGSWCE